MADLGNSSLSKKNYKNMSIEELNIELYKNSSQPKSKTFSHLKREPTDNQTSTTVKDLKENVISLEHGNKLLKLENERLKREKEHLIKKNDKERVFLEEKLVKAINRVSQTEASLSKQLVDMETHKDYLADQNETLQKKIEELENSMLAIEEEKIREIDGISKERINMQQENNELVSRISILERTILKLEDELKKINEERESVLRENAGLREDNTLIKEEYTRKIKHVFGEVEKREKIHNNEKKVLAKDKKLLKNRLYQNRANSATKHRLFQDTILNLKKNMTFAKNLKANDKCDKIHGEPALQRSSSSIAIIKRPRKVRQEEESGLKMIKMIDRVVKTEDKVRALKLKRAKLEKKMKKAKNNAELDLLEGKLLLVRDALDREQRILNELREEKEEALGESASVIV